jgi:hypothetical protein
MKFSIWETPEILWWRALHMNRAHSEETAHLELWSFAYCFAWNDI